MGRAKLALRDADGVRLLDRPAAALRATCARLRVVGALPGDLPAPAGFAPLADARPTAAPDDGCAGGRQGPLAGLVAALEDGEEDWVLLCAGDMPEVEAALLCALQDEAERAPRSACMPAGAHGPEPALSAWPRSRAGEVRARFDAGERALHRALPDDAIRLWPQRDWTAVAGAQALRNLNTPADWRDWSGEALPGS